MTRTRSRDSSMIQDRRGIGRPTSGGGLGDILGGALGGRGNAPSSGGGGRGGRGGGGLLKGGGAIGILLLLATIILPQLLGGGAGQSSELGGGSAPSEQTTGGDDDTCSSEAEQILCGATIDVQEYWGEQYPASFDKLAYPQTQTVFFSGFTNTGCGRASAQTGPFYCPADNLVYFDLDFLAQLQSRFGAEGDLAAQYIVAHEYGHHVQHALGINAEMNRLQRQDPRNANAYSIALELQADCLAGAWASDAIHQATQGRVDPETWTHGSSEQRVRWFTVGFETGDPNRCDTFGNLNNL